MHKFTNGSRVVSSRGRESIGKRRRTYGVVEHIHIEPNKTGRGIAVSKVVGRQCGYVIESAADGSTQFSYGRERDIERDYQYRDVFIHGFQRMDMFEHVTEFCGK